MANQTIWIVIVIAVFFVGVGASYAHFTSTYDPMSMKFQNQEFFNQMMSNNPKMSQQWMMENMMDLTSDSPVNPTSVFLEPLKCNADQIFVENNLCRK